ncbi:MAG TPA: hypothetical protein VGD01_09265 [Candidatus Elarobacter sp.]
MRNGATPSLRRRASSTATTWPTPWISTIPAVSALITASSGSSEAGSASVPMTTSDTAGKRPLRCRRANAGRKSPPAAAAYGMRDAASSKPYVDANAVIITASVTATANGAPTARSATSDAIAVEPAISFGLTAAATPRLSRT